MIEIKIRKVYSLVVLGLRERNIRDSYIEVNRTLK